MRKRNDLFRLRVATAAEQIGAILHSHQFLLQLRSDQMMHGM